MTVLMLNGELLAPEKATLPATDRALTHGLGLYETLKLVDGVPVFFEEHVARLDLGLDELGLERPCSRAEMAAQIRRLSAAGDVPDGACRVLVTAGPPQGTPGLLIQTDRRRFPARPLRVISYLGVRVRAQLKAMTVMQSYLAQRAATAAGADDAILVDDCLLYTSPRPATSSTAPAACWSPPACPTAGRLCSFRPIRASSPTGRYA